LRLNRKDPILVRAASAAPLCSDDDDEPCKPTAKIGRRYVTATLATLQLVGAIFTLH
jgi:hypothetical protein